MKNKQNSFCRQLNYSKRPSSFIKYKNSFLAPSLKSNRKISNYYHSPDKENELLLIKLKFLNNKKNYKFQSSYFSFLAPILSFKKQSKISNQTKKNNLILTSVDNSSMAKKAKDKIFPYEYNKSKKKVVNNNMLKKSTINNLNKNNISLANFLSVNKKKKSRKKSKKHITPDSHSYNKNKKINAKLNTEKRNSNKKAKNFFTTSIRTRKNSRGWSDKGKEKEKGRENLMKKLNILDFRKLAKPHSKIINGECFTFKGSHHYGYGLTYDSNRKNKKNNFIVNNNKKKYGVNHFMDYLRGAKFFKYNHNKTNKNISISSLGNISYKKVANNNSNNNNSHTANRIKSPINVNNSCTSTINNISNNIKINKNSMIYSIKNISLINSLKNKKVNSKEHKKTKSINIGPCLIHV